MALKRVQPRPRAPGAAVLTRPLVASHLCRNKAGAAGSTTEVGRVTSTDEAGTR